jgi:hypothetical protein
MMRFNFFVVPFFLLFGLAIKAKACDIEQEKDKEAFLVQYSGSLPMNSVFYDTLHRRVLTLKDCRMSVPFNLVERYNTIEFKQKDNMPNKFSVYLMEMPIISKENEKIQLIKFFWICSFDGIDKAHNVVYFGLSKDKKAINFSKEIGYINKPWFLYSYSGKLLYQHSSLQNQLKHSHLSFVSNANSIEIYGNNTETLKNTIDRKTGDFIACFPEILIKSFHLSAFL